MTNTKEFRCEYLSGSDHRVVGLLLLLGVIAVPLFLPMLIFFSFMVGAAIASCLISRIDGDFSPAQRQLLEALAEISYTEIIFGATDCELPSDIQERRISLRHQASMRGIADQAVEEAIACGRKLAQNEMYPGLTFWHG